MNKLMHPTMTSSMQTAVPNMASSVASLAGINCGDIGEKVAGAVLMSAQPPKSIEEAVEQKSTQQILLNTPQSPTFMHMRGVRWAQQSAITPCPLLQLQMKKKKNI